MFSAVKSDKLHFIIMNYAKYVHVYRNVKDLHIYIYAACKITTVFANSGTLNICMVNKGSLSYNALFSSHYNISNNTLNEMSHHSFQLDVSPFLLPILLF